MTIEHEIYWHSKKGWDQTCNFIMTAPPHVQQLMLAGIKGVMANEQAYRMYKYSWIAESTRMGKAAVLYWTDVEKTKKDFTKLIASKFT